MTWIRQCIYGCKEFAGIHWDQNSFSCYGIINNEGVNVAIWDDMNDIYFQIHGPSFKSVMNTKNYLEKKCNDPRENENLFNLKLKIRNVNPWLLQ